MKNIEIFLEILIKFENDKMTHVLCCAVLCCAVLCCAVLLRIKPTHNPDLEFEIDYLVDDW
jgi:hypothetical protein